jgi:hypothetical protein
MSGTPNQTPGPRKRVRVTAPQTGTPRRGAVHPVSMEIDEQTRLGELYMATLIRAQWRLSMSVLGSAAMMIGGLPLLFLFVPATRTLSVGPIPLPWLILGVLIYPAIWLAGRYYVRQSEQIEREFTELVARR